MSSPSPQLFLDCDGVLADFDRGAERVLGMGPRAYEAKHGRKAFWRALAKTPGFYARLPLMPDACALFDAVRHLDPVILTGCPMGGWAEAQKERWAAEHFPDTRIITCMARDKWRHCTRGDVLVDDTLKHRGAWEEACGVFVHHRSARESIAELATLFPGVDAPRELA